MFGIGLSHVRILWSCLEITGLHRSAFANSIRPDTEWTRNIALFTEF